jgi:tetratricopeptide (TPR) repeat protein
MLERVQLLHRGRDRELWRVRDATDGHTEILKSAPVQAPAEARRALADEFLLLERIRHAHWVRPLGFIHLDDGSCGYRMEEGGRPVSEAAGDGWLPRDLGSVRELLGALSCLHALGFAHLDIKPSQLLQCDDGVRLIDPGLAAPEGSSLAPRGTWGFIAPEVLSGGSWDRRVDFYALGCVLVQIWTGENPLGTGEIAEQIRRQQSRPRLRLRERVPEIPEGLDRVIESLLDPDPERRPRTARDVWSALHTMAAYREGYAERRQLPHPHDLPFLGVEEGEAAWDRALDGEGADRWVIAGTIGSGRRRLLERLRARAEVAGFVCDAQPDALLACRHDPAGGTREIRCRIGSPSRGEHPIELGAAGERVAAAALEAYGLDAEGDEARWTRGLLRLRLEERLGAEGERRRSARTRRTFAAALGGALSGDDRMRLATLLVRESDDVSIPAVPGEPLIALGLARSGNSETLEPASPPWDTQALSVIAGEAMIAAAHRKLLDPAGTRPVATAAHAIGCGDVDRALAAVPAAVALLREEGDLGRAFDLLTAARELLGARCPAPRAIDQAAVALEDGTPARALSLLGPTGPSLPDAWRTLIEGHLLYRSGRRAEAIVAARAAQQTTEEPRVARAAEMIVIRSQRLLGEIEAAEAGARKLMGDAPAEAPIADRLRPAALLLSMLSARGEAEEVCAPLRELCVRGLPTVGGRERHEVAAALGAEAFQRGDFAAAGRFMETAVDAAAACHDMTNLAIGQMNLAGVYFEEGRTAECEDLNRQALRACVDLGLENQAANARRNLATVLMAASRLDDALNLCRKARQILGTNAESPDALATIAVEGEILVESGLLESARVVLEDAVRRLEENPVPSVGTIIWRDVARLERWTGQLQQASAHFAEARRQAQEAGASDDEARALVETACLCAAIGDRDGTARALNDAAPLVRASTSVELALHFDFAQAMHQAIGDPRAATDLLQAATERAARAHFTGWLWRCHAAASGVAKSLGDAERTLRSIQAARRALLDLLHGIGPDAMRESYVMLWDARLFLAWCDEETDTRKELPHGGSDLEVFLR